MEKCSELLTCQLRLVRKMKKNTLSKKEKMKTHTKVASISTLPHIHTLVHYSNNNQAARNHLESQFRDCA